MNRGAITSLLFGVSLLAACKHGPVTFELKANPQEFSGPVTVSISDGTDSPPETFEIDPSKLEGLTYESKSVTVGERWSISVTGPASDGCNTTSADANGKAEASPVKVTLSDYATTEMDCEPE